MDLKLIKKILDLIEESDVNEVALEEGDFKIKVKKSANIEHVTYTQAAAPSQPPPPPAPHIQKQEQGSSSSGREGAKESQPDGEVVKSPIVGTFYEAPDPESEPFLKVGDKISKGQTLCIIEAMKIMNEIEAEFGGTVQKILVNNAQPVEYDQPLFIIKKD